MKNLENYTMEIDTLAVGLTRVPLVMGVSLKLAFANLMVCTLGYIYIRSFWVFLVCGIFHLIAMRLSIKEPRFFELHVKRLHLTSWVLNFSFWGGLNSYEPW